MMKRMKLMIAIVLLASLLLSSCGQPAAQPVGAEKAAGTDTAEPLVLAVQKENTQPVPSAVQEDLPLLAAAPEAQANAAAPMPLAAADGEVRQERVKSDLFHAKFEGDSVAGSGEAVDGVYRFIATETDGEAWHVKLECSYPTVAGRDYRVTYRFRSDVAGTVKFGDFQEFAIGEGDNSVTGVLTASGGSSYLDLQLGMLPPFTIDFTEVEVEEYADVVDYENALPAPVDFSQEAAVYEAHDEDYDPALTRAADAVSVNYRAVSAEPGVWKSRLFIQTGLIPEPGVQYHVAADLACDRDLPFEVLFNNGGEEKGYGALYGQSVAAGGTKTCEAVITGADGGGELVLQFSLGEAPEGATVTIGNLRVETFSDRYANVLPSGFALDSTVATGRILSGMVPEAYEEIPLTSFSYDGTDTVYEGHDDGYVVELEESASSATLKITQAPADAGERGVWKVRLYAATGVTPEAGTSYRIAFNLASEGSQADYEACFDGDYENAYGALYARSLTAGGTDHVELIVTPDVSHGPLTIRLQMGKTDSAAGNTVTLSNLSVEALTPQYQPVGEVSLSTGGEGNVWEEHYDGLEQSLTVSGSAAVLDVSAPRSEGGVWSSKLCVKTGFTPEAGVKYRFSAAVDATADTGDFEILYQNSGAEELYGGQWGLNGSGEYASEFRAPASGCGELVLVFQLGSTATPNTITINELRLCALGGGTEVAVEMPGFAYPEAGVDTTTYNSFDLEANSGAEASLTGDGSSATATVTTPGDDWHVKLYAKPGVELEAGESYTVSMDVTGAEGCTACYKNTATGDEEGFGTETIGSGAVTHTVTPAENGTLEILLKIGTVPAGGMVTVSDIAISRLGGEEAGDNLLTEALTAGTRGNVNFWAHEDYAAAISGDGSAAELAISAAPAEGGEAWKVKLFVETGLTLEEGKHYRISADLSASAETDYEICYNNGAEEKGVGALYGLHASAETQTAVFEATAESAAELILQFNLGWASAPCTVTVSHVLVEEMVDGAGESVLPAFSYDSVGSFSTAADGGYIVSLDKEASSATLHIEQAPEERNPWNVKLNIRTGFTPEKDRGYEVSFDIDADKAQQDFEVFYDGDAEAAYGQLTGKSLSAGKQNVSFTITPGDSRGQLTLQLRFGRTDGTDGNSYTISNVKIEEVTFRYTQMPETVTVTTLDSQGGYSTQLDKTPDTATVRIEGTPAEGLEAWKSKLFVQTGVTLKAGQKYRIRMSVTADSPAPSEICFNNGDEEKGLGAIYGLTAGPDGESIEYLAVPKQDTRLVIQLSHGNCEAPNSITLSGLSVEKAGPVELVSDTIYTF